MRVYFSETKFDFPKKINDLRIAWFREGRICISRNYKKRDLQEQNFQIIRINRIVKDLYQKVKKTFKADLAEYSKLYKRRYPRLRKRGMSSYAVFLMIIHGIIKRFNIESRNDQKIGEILISLISSFSVLDFIRTGLLKEVKGYYRLNKKAVTEVFTMNLYEEDEYDRSFSHYFIDKEIRLINQSPI